MGVALQFVAYFNSQTMRPETELIPFRDFEDVFVKETDPLAKYVFLPMVSIIIKGHAKLGNVTLHLISIWDTGDYKKGFFGDYRTDVNLISFDVIGDKLGYKDKIIFPCIEHLQKAYEIIVNDFETHKDNYLNGLEYETQSKEMDRGAALILKKIPYFGNFEAKYYFERITSALLGKYRFHKYGVVNAFFDNNHYFYHTKGETCSGEASNLEFNQTGKTNLVDNLFGQPEFIQSDETPVGSIFIGQVDELDYNSTGSGNTYLFFDGKSRKQVQVFQWD